jgi:hypothetical protein
LNASTLLMSGFGAPARTAAPINERARSARLEATTLPSLIKLSNDSPTTITTSTGSPRAIRFGTACGVLPIDGPHVFAILWPVARSNSAASSR